MANQFELHPLCRQLDIVEASRARSIAVIAYSSLARAAPELLAAPAVAAAAAAHGVTPAQVALRWAVQHGYATIPKSIREERVIENGPSNVGEGASWALSDAEMASIDALGKEQPELRTCWNPYTVS